MVLCRLEVPMDTENLRFLYTLKIRGRYPYTLEIRGPRRVSQLYDGNSHKDVSCFRSRRICWRSLAKGGMTTDWPWFGSCLDYIIGLYRLASGLECACRYLIGLKSIPCNLFEIKILIESFFLNLSSTYFYFCWSYTLKSSYFSFNLTSSG